MEEEDKITRMAFNKENQRNEILQSIESQGNE